MIFKTLFKKKKWLSDKVSERIAAVAELNVNDKDNKAILHELAFNDGEEQVRRATLEKLSDFSLWWQTFKNDPSENLKNIAEKNIIGALKGDNKVPLDKQLKHKFVEQCNKSKILEQILFHLDDQNLMLEVLKKLDKEALYIEALISDKLDLEYKSTIVDLIDDIDTLKRAAKKVSGDVAQEVNDKIELLIKQAEKPKLVEKEIKLILAKLNALKDKQNYPDIKNQLAELEKQWQSLEFNVLVEDRQKEVKDKYVSILKSVNNVIAPLKQRWVELQNQAETEQRHKENAQQISQELKLIESKVTAAIDAEQTDDSVTTDISELINELLKRVNNTDIKEQDKHQFKLDAESIFNRAAQVPQIKAAIDTAKKLLAELQQLELPTNMVEYNALREKYRQLTIQWRENSDNINISLPVHVLQPYQEMMSKWQAASEVFEKEQRNLFNQTKRKLGELEHLIQIGKFKSAFGLFTKLSHWREELNQYQLSKIDRQWQDVEQDINKLHDLEQSIAEPKKQELIDEAEKLANNPLIDPTEQAHRVRMLRKNWQTLPYGGTEQDEQFKKRFNDLCEIAFAPCREHYQEEEQIREENFQAKILIIQQLESIKQKLNSDTVQDWRELESVYVKLTKVWRETGLVDKDKVEEINSRFRAATKPIKDAISSYHKNNEQAKQALIAKAKQIVGVDTDLTEQIEQLKQLQDKWKKIGFAGRNIDQKLWKLFREINDPIFSQRDEQKNKEFDASNQKMEQVLAQLEQLEKEAEESSEISELSKAKSAVKDILAETKELMRPQQSKLTKVASNIVNKIDGLISSANKQKRSQSYLDLFLVVEKLANGEAANMQGLKPAWTAAINQNNKEKRDEVTVMIEIVAGLTSPKEVQALRNQVQMQLLSNKLEDGHVWHTDDLLEKWLAAGPFEKSDISNLARIKPAFI